MKSFTLPMLMLVLFTFPSVKSQPQLELQPFATGLSIPIAVVNAGDERLFAVQQRGLVRIIDADGTVSATPFLDLSAKVSQSGSETGLLGLAFHPNYDENGYFFVNYTRLSDGSTIVSRFTLSDSNPNVADNTSEKILLTLTQPYSNHNGGQLLFGPDGYLYIFLGDGGSGGDSQNYAQTRSSLLGKLLRIDVNVDAEKLFVIPPDNPYVGDVTTRDEIWALGLRNPWRNSFDRYTGDLWIADVGQGAREEINFQPASSPGGENYGWRCYEGNIPYNLNGCQDGSNYVYPVFDYQHQGTGCTGSVTGGYVYRGTLYNGISGIYLFADYCTGNFYQISQSEGQFNGSLFMTDSRFQYASFGEDMYGELYTVMLGAGEVRKIVETGDCKPVAKIMENAIVSGNSASVEAILEAFFHPNLEYQWYKDETIIPEATEHILQVPESGQFTVMVTNPDNQCFNTSESVEIILQPTFIAPNRLDGLHVFPNPANDYLIVEGLPLEGTNIISLLDVTGNNLISLSSSNFTTFNISLQTIPSGLYFLQVTNGNDVKREKILVNR
jgi:hypothetical protein